MLILNSKSINESRIRNIINLRSIFISTCPLNKILSYIHCWIFLLSSTSLLVFWSCKIHQKPKLNVDLIIEFVTLNLVRRLMIKKKRIILKLSSWSVWVFSFFLIIRGGQWVSRHQSKVHVCSCPCRVVPTMCFMPYRIVPNFFGLGPTRHMCCAVPCRRKKAHKLFSFFFF